MGNKKSKQLSNDILLLKNQLQELKNIDKNDDGFITKDEFLDWKKNQRDKLDELEKNIEKRVTDKYNKILVEKDLELNQTKNKMGELTKQLESLKNMNSMLEAKLLDKNKTLEVENANLSEISKHKIDEFVEELLKNENVNIGYLPDFVERQIYKNIFGVLIGLMETTLKTTSINFLGHQMSFNVKPEIDKLSD